MTKLKGMHHKKLESIQLDVSGSVCACVCVHAHVSAWVYLSYH